MRYVGAYATIAVIVAAVFAAGILGGGFRAVERSDYMTYHVAARIILDGKGSCLYDVACQSAEQQELIGQDPSFERGALPFNSPPWFAALVTPLGLLPLHAAFAIFVLLSLGLLAVAGWLSAWEGVGTRLLAAVLLLTAWPTVMAAIRGQSTLLAVALLGMSVAGSGVALGLAGIKPTLGPLWVLWLLIRRRWRELAVALAVLLALVLAGVLIASPQALLDYPEHLLGVAAPDALGVHVEQMINWRGAAQRLGVGLPLIVGGTLLTLIATALAWWSSGSRQLAAAAAFVATPLVIPHANQHESVLAALGVLLAIGAAGRYRRPLVAAGVLTHAALWMGPVLESISAEASAWLLFAAMLAWLAVVVWLALRDRSGASAVLPSGTGA